MVYSRLFTVYGRLATTYVRPSTIYGGRLTIYGIHSTVSEHAVRSTVDGVRSAVDSPQVYTDALWSTVDRLLPGVYVRPSTVCGLCSRVYSRRLTVYGQLRACTVNEDGVRCTIDDYCLRRPSTVYGRAYTVYDLR